MHDDVVGNSRPVGVDVASGVEATPGRKRPERLAAFIRNARKAKGAARTQTTRGADATRYENDFRIEGVPQP